MDSAGVTNNAREEVVGGVSETPNLDGIIPLGQMKTEPAEMAEAEFGEFSWGQGPAEGAAGEQGWTQDEEIAYFRNEVQSLRRTEEELRQLVGTQAEEVGYLRNELQGYKQEQIQLRQLVGTLAEKVNKHDEILGEQNVSFGGGVRLKEAAVDNSREEVDLSRVKIEPMELPISRDDLEVGNEWDLGRVKREPMEVLTTDLEEGHEWDLSRVKSEPMELPTSRDDLGEGDEWDLNKVKNEPAELLTDELEVESARDSPRESVSTSATTVVSSIEGEDDLDGLPTPTSDCDGPSGKQDDPLGNFENEKLQENSSSERCSIKMEKDESNKTSQGEDLDSIWSYKRYKEEDFALSPSPSHPSHLFANAKTRRSSPSPREWKHLDGGVDRDREPKRSHTHRHLHHHHHHREKHYHCRHHHRSAERKHKKTYAKKSVASSMETQCGSYKRGGDDKAHWQKSSETKFKSYEWESYQSKQVSGFKLSFIEKMYRTPGAESPQSPQDDKTIHQCPNCPKKVQGGANMAAHFKTHKYFKCYLCELEFSFETSLLHHLRKVHRKSGANAY